MTPFVFIGFTFQTHRKDMTGKFLVISAGKKKKNLPVIQFLEYISLQNTWNIFKLHLLPKPLYYVTHLSQGS